ncbi:hypothetical protein P7C70_g2013, partial [Phenoliferia sp. Uapishka_3]
MWGLESPELKRLTLAFTGAAVMKDLLTARGLFPNLEDAVLINFQPERTPTTPASDLLSLPKNVLAVGCRLDPTAEGLTVQKFSGAEVLVLDGSRTPDPAGLAEDAYLDEVPDSVKTLVIPGEGNVWKHCVSRVFDPLTPPSMPNLAELVFRPPSEDREQLLKNMSRRGVELREDVPPDDDELCWKLKQTVPWERRVAFYTAQLAYAKSVRLKYAQRPPPPSRSGHESGRCGAACESATSGSAPRGGSSQKVLKRLRSTLNGDDSASGAIPCPMIRSQHEARRDRELFETRYHHHPRSLIPIIGSSPSTARIIFQDTKSSSTTFLLTSHELKLIWRPETAPDETYLATRSRTLAPILALHSSILRQISRSAGADQLEELKRALGLLESLQVFIDESIEMITGGDSSHGKRMNPRESDFIWWFIIFECVTSDLLFACYCTVQHIVDHFPSAEAALLAEHAKSHLEQGWALLSKHSELMMAVLISTSHRETLKRARTLTATLTSSRGPVFFSWCLQHPREAGILLEVVTLAAFGDGAAARFGVEMRKALRRKVADALITSVDGEESRGLSVKVVEAALASLVLEPM